MKFNEIFDIENNSIVMKKQLQLGIFLLNKFLVRKLDL